MAAVIPRSPEPMQKTEEYNMKTFYRAGSAAYSLRQFFQAVEYMYFRRGLELCPNDDDLRLVLASATCNARLLEQSQAKYDFNLSH
jgi:hypothetical protein